jgi:hypothetical protein
MTWRYRGPRETPGYDSRAMNALRRLARRLARVRRRPIVCRICGANLGFVRAMVRDGRLQLRDLDETVRVRWTAEDELAFEHVRDAECVRR